MMTSYSVRFFVGLAGLFALSTLHAQTIAAPRAPGRGTEWRTEFTTTGRSDIAEGSRTLGEIRHQHALVEGVGTFALAGDASLLAGVSWKRFDFSGSRADVPGSLTMLAVKLGYARMLSPQWSLRAEIDPGIYSDLEDIGSDDFNAPFGVRALYAASRDLQWGFALLVDPRSRRPVIGGVGARWRFAARWTLLAFVPAPRVEYEVSPQFTLFAGAAIRGGTFRVGDDFGRRRGRPALDNQTIDFREITVGAGARWQLQPGLSANVGVGWMLDRRFEFDERDLLINGDGAPSFTISMSGAF